MDELVKEADETTIKWQPKRYKITKENFIRKHHDFFESPGLKDSHITAEDLNEIFKSEERLGESKLEIKDSPVAKEIRSRSVFAISPL